MRILVFKVLVLVYWRDNIPKEIVALLAPLFPLEILLEGFVFGIF